MYGLKLEKASVNKSYIPVGNWLDEYDIVRRRFRQVKKFNSQPVKYYKK